MNPLQKLELEILQIHDRISLRPTLELVARIGSRLTEAKKLLPHGAWLPWVRRIGLKPRSAQIYMQVAVEYDGETGKVSVEKFLRQMKLAKLRIAARMLADMRANAKGQRQRGDIRIVHADCRRYDWPRDVDVIATDPPWGEIALYRWLASFASSHLRPGGLLLVQSAPWMLPQHLQALRCEGLKYVWTFAVIYGAAGAVKYIASSIRPVVFMCKGRWVHHSLPFSDTHTVTGHLKKYHEWEQPVDPWAYWLGRLTSPGALVVDPFAGSGSFAVACREVGLQYIGTEEDKITCKIAQDRLAEQV